MTPQEAYKKCVKKNHRIPKLENIIAKDSAYSYLYAQDVINGRFELGEKTIIKDPECSYYYARHIIKKPFEKSHYIIFNSRYKNDYIKFLKSIDYDMNKISEWLL